MIKAIRLQRLKCFLDESINLGRLSVLTGKNGTGKSTFAQSIVLLNQTIRNNKLATDIILNGEDIQLGYFSEIINHFSDVEEGFSITFLSDREDEYVHWDIKKNEESDLVGRIASITISWENPLPEYKYGEYVISGIYNIDEKTKEIVVEGWDSKKYKGFYIENLFPTIPIRAMEQVEELIPEYEDLHTQYSGSPDYAGVISFWDSFRIVSGWNEGFKMVKELYKLDRIKYVSAERIGPRETYHGYQKGIYDSVGSKGEFTAQYLCNNKNKKIHKGFIKNKRLGNTLQHQINYWLSNIIQNQNVNFKNIESTNLFRISYQNSGQSSFNRPTNSAFGLTYVLPIIAVCLGSEVGDTVIIENPEAHLHPMSQSRMGEFLALSASTGVNVIIETHSDHVINGIRKSVYSGVLKPSDIEITFFDRDEQGFPLISNPKIDDKGKINDWPQGFFDQFELDLSFLMGFKNENIS